MADLENRTRLSFFLPVNDLAERNAARRIILAISRRYGGATQSLLEPSAFRGYWIAGDDLIDDEVSLVFVDVPHEANDPGLLMDLDALKLSIFDAYRLAGSPQDEVWLMVHPIQRVV